MCEEYIIKINKILDRMMLCIYCLSLLLEASYIYLISARSALWASANQSVTIFYALTCGILFAIDVFLIFGVTRKSHAFYLLPLLLIYAAVQAMTIMADLACNVFYGGYWNTGFVFFIVEAAGVIVYTGRYFVLKAEREFLTKNINGKKG